MTQELTWQSFYQQGYRIKAKVIEKTIAEYAMGQIDYHASLDAHKIIPETVLNKNGGQSQVTYIVYNVHCPEKNLIEAHDLKQLIAEIRNTIPQTYDQDKFLLNSVTLAKQMIHVPDKNEQLKYAQSLMLDSKTSIKDLTKLRTEIGNHLDQPIYRTYLAAMYHFNPLLKYAKATVTKKDCDKVKELKLEAITSIKNILTGDVATIKNPNELFDDSVCQA